MTLPDASEDTAAIRAEIENTRSDMSETIDALQERLAPERVTEQVKEKVREQAAEAYTSARATVKDKAGRILSDMTSTVREAGSTAGTFASNMGSSLMDTRVGTTVRQNPLPFALIGAGLTMLLMNRRKQARTPYYADRVEPYRGYDRTETFRAYDTSSEMYGESGSGMDTTTSGMGDTGTGVGGAGSGMASRAGEVVSSAKDTVSQTASSVRARTRQGLSAVGSRARQTSTRATGAFQSALRENPLAVGVAAVAVGSVVGLALPVTSTEQQYMGETRDQLMDRASSVARETVEKVQRVAEDAGRTVQQQVRENLSSQS